MIEMRHAELEIEPKEKNIGVTVEGGCGVISLNRPAAMNALTLGMVQNISTALACFKTDPRITQVLLRSANDRSFCAGGDMRHIRKLILAKKFDEAEQFFEEEYNLILEMSRYPKPLIALVDGICMGGGMGLVMQCPYRIATERAVFAMPETALGFFPDVGGSYFLTHLPFRAGYWLGLTGAHIGYLDANSLKITTHLIVKNDMQRLTNSICKERGTVDQALKANSTVLGYDSSVLGLADTSMCFDQPTICTILECLKARGSKAALDAHMKMSGASPRSLQETLSLLREGRGLTLESCLDRELAAAKRAIRHPDLVEGVRAVLVDKDHAPKWHTATISHLH